MDTGNFVLHLRGQGKVKVVVVKKKPETSLCVDAATIDLWCFTEKPTRVLVNLEASVDVKYVSVISK